MPEVDATAVVLRDAFPARVVAGDRVWSTARVIVTRDRVLVYLDRSGPVLDEPYNPEVSVVPAYNAPSFRPAHLVLVDGTEVTATRQRGCACSSTLRGWRPWSPYRVATR